MVTNINTWLAEENLLPGQDWDLEIRKAIREADVVIICLSHSSISKTGYIQKEIKIALDIALELPEGTAFIIPVRLEECDVPDQLKLFQWVNLYERDGFDKLIRALNTRAKSISRVPISQSVVIEQVVHEQEVRAAVSDTPKIDLKDDRLEFRPYVDALHGFITAPETTTPLVISINGSWGSGKSSLMGMLKRRLDPREGYYSDLLWQGLAWHVGQFGRRKLTDKQKADHELIKQRVKHLRLSRYMLKRAHVEEGEKMERILEHIARNERMELIYYPTVWFNAWKFSEESQIWAALASEIINQLNGKQYALPTRLQFWFQLKRANLISALRPVMLNLLLISVLALLTVLYPSFIYPFIVNHIFPFFQALFPTQSAAKAASTTATLGGVALLLSTASQIFKSARQIAKAHPFQISIKTMIENPNYQEKIGYISQFSQDFKRIVEVATRSSSPAWQTQKLVIFIDDLDRCRPLQAVGIIEAISLFLDSEQCVFILGIDADAVSASIEAKYKELVEKIHRDRPEVVSFGRSFLEKIIQISLTIPYADSTHIDQLIMSLTQVSTVTSEPGPLLSKNDSVTSNNAGSPLKEREELDKDQEATLATQREVRAYFQSEDVQKAIKDAGRLLKRNPRRIKQFINLFRLKMFLINHDKENMSYFEENKEKLEDFVFMLAWSMQWSDIARIITDSPHSAEVCDYLLFLGKKYQAATEQVSNQQMRADADASQSSELSDIIETPCYDPSIFETITADLKDRRSKVESFPAHWCYLPWEEWIYDKGFRFCTLHFHDQWQLRKDGETAPLLELIRL